MNDVSRLLITCYCINHSLFFSAGWSCLEELFSGSGHFFSAGIGYTGTTNDY